MTSHELFALLGAGAFILGGWELARVSVLAVVRFPRWFK